MHIKGEQGSKTIFDQLAEEAITRHSYYWFSILDRIILEILRQKLKEEARAGSHGQHPCSTQNICFSHLRGLSGKILGRHKRRSKLKCAAIYIPLVALDNELKAPHIELKALHNELKALHIELKSLHIE